MKDIDYKSLFFRFLKEKKIYGIWVKIIKNNSWKELYSRYFELNNPIYYLERSFNEYNSYERITNDRRIENKLICADFEWKILCSKVDKKYFSHVVKFVNTSRYFTFSNLGYELIREYKHLKKPNDINDY